MDKLKKVFSPGSSKDDEVLYGDAEARRQASVSNAGAASEQSTEPLRPVEGSQKKEGGILRQILNPGGEKYDEQAFGANATTEPVDPDKMQTHPEHQKDHTVLGQILNPGGHKYDEQRFGTTGATTGDGRRESVRPEVGKDAIVSPESKLATAETQKDHSILRQIINPGGDNYDSTAYGRNASVVSGEEHSRLQSQSEASRQKDSSITRQILNPGQEKYDPVVYGAGPSASGTAPAAGAGSSRTDDQTAQADNSHVGRDAAIAGGVGVAGAGAYAASKHDQEPKEYKDPSTSTQTTTQTTTTTTQSAPSQSTYQPTSQQPDNSHLGRDAAVVGGVGAAGAGTYAATHRDNEPKGYTAPSSTTQSTTQGDFPQSTSEYNTQSGYGQPASQTQTGYQQSASQGTGVAQSAYPQSTSEYTPQASDNSHLGRDAAIAGGVGAAGAGAYAATQHHNRPTEESTESRIADRGHPLGGRSADNPVNPISAPESTYEATSSRPDNSHLGRDAAIAGGVGAAGAGAYGVSQHDSSKITERPHPLSNRGGEGHINPISAPELPEEQPSNHPHREAAIIGGTGVIGGAAASSQLNQAPADVQNATYTERAVPLGGGYHHSSGPHSTDTANRLDPHIPGEFPTEDGEDRHGLNPPTAYGGQSTSNPATGSSTGATNASTYSQAPDVQPEHHYARDAALGTAGGAGAGAAAYGLSSNDRSSQAPAQSAAATSHPGGQNYPVAPSTSSSAYSQAPGVQPEHHHARDAALGTGAGVAGVGAYEAFKSHDPTGPASKTIGPHDSNTANVVDPRVQPDPHQQVSSHHYGRDAPIVGGTGAVGAAAYGATQGRGDTGPASKTVGPHNSNVANIVDPRVQPQPSKMKEQSTTTGPHQSDLANKADPRVDSDASKQESSHKGRDAGLVAGGVGAGAAAGYGAEQLIDEKEQKKLEKQHTKELEKQQKEAEREAKSQQKEAEKLEKQHQKDIAKEEKAQQKEAEKAEKQHQKEVARAEKQHEKEVAKEQKAHEKVVAKQEKQHEKEVAKEEKQQQKELEKEEKERERHEKEAAAAAGVGAAGVGAAGVYEAEKHHGAQDGTTAAGQQAYGSQTTGPAEQQAGQYTSGTHPVEQQAAGYGTAAAAGQSAYGTHPTERQAEHPTSSAEQTGRSSYDTAETDHSGEHKKRGLIDRILHPTRKSEDDDRVHADEGGHNKLHKKHVPKEHQTATGSSNLAEGREGENLVAGPEYVTEPHTGLPMNVGKYGTGQGGTDGAEQIQGYHQHPSGATGAEGTTGAQTGPDWNAIKKENTPY